jgi:hypothetical protein
MANRRKNKKDPDELASENEFLKLKMMAEFGGNFMGSGDKMPVDLENQFLKQIIQYHKLHNESKIVTIYQYLGEPEYNHVHDLSDKQVKKDLRILLKLLQKHGIKLDVLAKTPARKVYRFVTEEFFKQPINNVKMKGWVSQFIYEDFYPNAEYDIKNAVHHLLSALFDKKGVLYEDFVSEELKDSLGLTTDIGELQRKKESFQEQYNDLILVDYDFIEVSINEKQGSAHLFVDVTFKTQKEKGKRTARHVTSVELTLRRDGLMKNIWMLTQLNNEFF